MPRVASIDLGSNTFRLLIVDLDDAGRLIERCARRVIVRLGQGLSDGTDLLPEAIERGIRAIIDFRTEVDRHAAGPVLAVATSAVRRARNRDKFIEKISCETGIEVEVIDGREEARMTCLGVQSALGRGANDMILDIGGGSTEWIVTRGGRIVSLSTINLGVVTLAERHLCSDTPSAAALEQLHEFVERTLESEHFDGAFDEHPRLIGTAGTLTTLAALDQGLDYRRAERVHGYVLYRNAVQRWERTLTRMSAARRRALPAVEPGREDLIIAGTAILFHVMDRLGAGSVLVSDAGLREGIIVDWWMKNRQRLESGCVGKWPQI